MKFRELSQYLLKLEKTASRNEITQILAQLLKKTSPEETEETVNLLLGRLAPAYEEVVFNIAERMMFPALAKAYRVPLSQVKKLYKEKGDLGDVAEKLAQNKGGLLSVTEVYRKLYEIAQEHGAGSQERKIEKMAKLLSSLDPLSARYVARIPVGKLRLGFSDKTILDALSVMERQDKSARGLLESAYFVRPDVALLAKQVKRRGIKKISLVPSPKVGVPVLPMLAQRLKSPQEMIKKMGRVAVEPKLDGLRLQIHFKAGRGGFVKGFTRNLNEVSWMFPELVQIEKYIKAKEVIIDTEAVGVDEKRQKLANFQTTMTRRRKHEIAKMAKKVPITFYVFDLLFKDGQGLMGQPYLKRREVLARTVKEDNLLRLTDYYLTDDPGEIARLNQEAKQKGLEGIMVKKADSAYVPGRTGWRWVKMKEAEKQLGKLADTVDAVVMGYYSGRGKRAQFGLGGFLVGIVDSEKIKTLTKIGTGLTDEQFRELKRRLKDLETDEKPKVYGLVDKTLAPDVWVVPKLVVEIAADEITKSPTHSSGFALRFPRLVKFRADKNPQQATSLAEIKRLFHLQNQ